MIISLTVMLSKQNVVKILIPQCLQFTDRILQCDRKMSHSCVCYFLSHRYNIFKCERFDVIAEARASQPSSVMAQSVSLQGEEEKKYT